MSSGVNGFRKWYCGLFGFGTKHSDFWGSALGRCFPSERCVNIGKESDIIMLCAAACWRPCVDDQRGILCTSEEGRSSDSCYHSWAADWVKGEELVLAVGAMTQRKDLDENSWVLSQKQLCKRKIAEHYKVTLVSLHIVETFCKLLKVPSYGTIGHTQKIISQTCNWEKNCGGRGSSHPILYNLKA